MVDYIKEHGESISVPLDKKVLDEITRNNDLINTFSWGESGFVEKVQLYLPKRV